MSIESTKRDLVSQTETTLVRLIAVAEAQPSLTLYYDENGTESDTYSCDFLDAIAWARSAFLDAITVCVKREDRHYYESRMHAYDERIEEIDNAYESNYAKHSGEES